MVICLERGADLHMAQLMPLPPTVSCSSKIQIGFTFLVPAHLGSPGQRAVKRMYVCLYILVSICISLSLCVYCLAGEVSKETSQGESERWCHQLWWRGLHAVILTLFNCKRLWVWLGECFFWYRPTRVVPDIRPLNSCVCVFNCKILRLSSYHFCNAVSLFPRL